MAELQPGDVVGPFVVEAVLGRGGMGVVYRARDSRLDRAVALKVVSPHLADNAEYRQRFITEARAAAAVDHRGIVPIFEVDEAGGALYIAMRLVDGEDLAAYARRRGPLPLEQALRLLAPVAEALDAAGKRGLVHRDVKPSNVLIASPDTAAPEVLLSDFGLAKTQGAEGVTQTGQFVGSVDYVAPEVIAAGGVDGRADQYALACVLYELVAGTPPYRREQPMQALFAHVNDAVPSLHALRADVPPAVDKALARGLAKSPEQRYPSSAALLNGVAATAGLAPIAHESSTALPVVPTAPASVSPASSSAPARRSRRTPMIVAVAVMVLAAVGGAAVLLGQGGGDSTSGGAGSVTAASTMSLADAAASALAEVTALREAFAAQQEFARKDRALTKLQEECWLSELRKRADCTLESTRIAEFAAVLDQAAEAGRRIPGLLDQASAGDPRACSNAVSQYADQAAKLWKGNIRALKVVRSQGYPERGENEVMEKALVNFDRLFADGVVQSRFANAFGVMVACTPSANWKVSEADVIARHQALQAYFLFRNEFVFSQDIENYCFALGGGSFVDGSNDETEVKTCLARLANPGKLSRARRVALGAFANLVGTSSWPDLPPKCVSSVKTAFQILDAMATHTIERQTALANNADHSAVAEIDKRAEGIDFAKWGRADRQNLACLTPEAVPPA